MRVRASARGGGQPPAIVSIVIATRTAGAIRRSRNRRLRIGRRTLFLADLSWPCQAKSLLLLPSLLQFDIGSLLDPLRHRRAPASRNARSPTSRGTRTYPCYATTSAQRPRSTTSAKSSEGDRGRTSPCSPMSQAECARSDGLYFSPSVAAAMQETVSRVWESTTGICRTTVECCQRVQIRSAIADRVELDRAEASTSPAWSVSFADGYRTPHIRAPSPDLANSGRGQVRAGHVHRCDRGTQRRCVRKRARSCPERGEPSMGCAHLHQRLWDRLSCVAGVGGRLRVRGEDGVQL